MTLKEIKSAIADGKTVHYKSALYKVVLHMDGEYILLCESTGHFIGLTWTDGVTMNGKESDFYTE